MELGADDIALLHSRGIRVIIGGGGQNYIGILGHDMVGMDKIKFCIRTHSVKKRRILFDVDSVPPDLGYG